MIFWLRFALRSCLRRRRRTILTLTGISFGVATLVVLGAVMVGVNDTMISNAVAVHTGNVVLKGGSLPLPQAEKRISRLFSGIEKIVSVETALPRLLFPGLISSKTAVLPVNIIAVDPEREAWQTPVAKRITAGNYLENSRGLLLGAGAAKKLAVKPGDQLTMMTASHSRKFKVNGIFSLGIKALDNSVVYISRKHMAAMPEIDVDYEMALFCRPGSDLREVADRVGALIQPQEKVSLWYEIMPDVAQLVKLNEFSMDIMVFLVIIILGFGVANALLISVMDRYRCFSILKAIGVYPREIFLVIMAEAFFMCLAAAVIGTVLGSSVTMFWADHGIDLSRYASANPHFSFNPIVYPRLTLRMVMVPQALALGVGVLAAVWPALVAGRRSVTQVMRGL